MKRVLIADDDEDSLKLLSHIVCKLDETQCDCARDGLEAILLYKRTVSEGASYAVLILDVMMPVKTGFEVSDFVRKESGDVETPIILLTALVEPLIRPHARYSRATEVWHKPIDVDEFLGRVEAVIEGRKLAAKP